MTMSPNKIGLMVFSIIHIISGQLPQNNTVDQVKDLNTEIEDEHKKLAEKESILSVLSQEVNELSEKLEFRRLQRILKTKNVEIDNLDNKITELNRKLHMCPKSANHYKTINGDHHAYSSDYLNSRGFITAFSAVEDTLQQEQLLNSAVDESSPTENRRFCIVLGSSQHSLNTSDEHPPPDLIPNIEKVSLTVLKYVSEVLKFL